MMFFQNSICRAFGDSRKMEQVSCGLFLTFTELCNCCKPGLSQTNVIQ